MRTTTYETRYETIRAKSPRSIKSVRVSLNMCKRLRAKANVSPFLSQTRSADQLDNRKYELNDTHVSLIEVNVNIDRTHM